MEPSKYLLQEAKPRTGTGVLACLLLACALLFPWLTKGPLRHWDEAWYAQASREMLRDSSWLTVRWNGAPWFHKPPLSLWATAASFKLLGETEFAARLFSALCTLALVVLLASFPWRPRGTSSDRSTGLLAALLLLGVPDFLKFTTRGQMDGPLAFLLAAQLVCFLKGLDQPRWHWLAGFCFGLAIMTKGAAAGLALVVQFAYVLVADDRRSLRQSAWWLSILLGIGIALPWHAHQAWVHGETFWREYGSRHFSQFFVPIHAEEASPPPSPLFYWNHLLHKQPPWGWLSLVTLAVATGFALRQRDRSLAFAICWGGAIPLALSFSRAKWSWYLIPAYPGMTLAASLLVAKSYAWRRHSAWILTVAAATAVVANIHLLRHVETKEYEEAIRALGPAVQRLVPRGDPIHALQTENPTRSVFAIAALFYCDRPVHVARGVEHFLEIAENAANPFYMLAHRDAVREIVSIAEARSRDPGYLMEIAAETDPLVLVRMTPTGTRSSFEETVRSDDVPRRRW